MAIPAVRVGAHVRTICHSRAVPLFAGFLGYSEHPSRHLYRLVLARVAEDSDYTTTHKTPVICPSIDSFGVLVPISRSLSARQVHTPAFCVLVDGVDEGRAYFDATSVGRRVRGNGERQASDESGSGYGTRECVAQFRIARFFSF